MNILITGISGFVGEYLAQELIKYTKNAQVFGIDQNNKSFKLFPKLNNNIRISSCDITDANKLEKIIKKIKPDQVYHLAGFASGAGKDKKLIFNVNVHGTINLLKALKNTNKKIKIMLASTAYVYGNTKVCAYENSKINAKSFYDQSKIEMEKQAQKYQSKKLQIVISRATNHTGPGQSLGFVVPDLASQIAKAENNNTIFVGNLVTQRDLFDVRDCVYAYRLIMQKGKSGEIYNIGMAQAVSIKTIFEKLIEISAKKISYKIDPKRQRPSDIAKNCVNHKKIKLLGWQPKINLNKTLKDTYNYWLNKKGLL